MIMIIMRKWQMDVVGGWLVGWWLLDGRFFCEGFFLAIQFRFTIKHLHHQYIWVRKMMMQNLFTEFKFFSFFFVVYFLICNNILRQKKTTLILKRSIMTHTHEVFKGFFFLFVFFSFILINAWMDYFDFFWLKIFLVFFPSCLVWL